MAWQTSGGRLGTARLCNGRVASREALLREATAAGSALSGSSVGVLEQSGDDAWEGTVWRECRDDLIGLDEPDDGLGGVVAVDDDYADSAEDDDDQQLPFGGADAEGCELDAMLWFDPRPSDGAPLATYARGGGQLLRGWQASAGFNRRLDGRWVEVTIV